MTGILTQNFGTRNSVVAMTKPNHLVLKPLKLSVGGIWKSLEMWAREAHECYKESLMGDSRWSSEDQDAHRNVNSKDLCP
jgi:hypothetical protein